MSGRLPPLSGLAERLLSRALALDPATLARLGTLAPDLLEVEITGTPWTFGLAPHGAGIALVPADQPRAGVCGDLPALLAWLGRGSETRIALRGDADFARRLADILRRGRPDLEEALSRLLGDVPAHYLGNAARELRDAAARTRDSLLGATGEYLQHERGALPSAEEFAVFSADLATLTAGLEQLEARLAALTRRGDA